MGKIWGTHDDAKSFLRDRGILKREPPTCSNCQRQMTEIKRSNQQIKSWRCPSHKGKLISLKRGSFLEGSNLPLETFVQLYFWVYQTPVMKCSVMTKVSQSTAVIWYGYFQGICSKQLLKNPIKLGGSGVVVEIDESVISKMKHHRGRRIPQRWVFGGIDTASKIGFCVG